MNELLTERQRELLMKVRNAIRKEPRDYRQSTYGTGTISCKTPGCIAGQIVDSEPQLQEKLRAKLDEYALSGPKDTVAAAVYGVARNALGAPAHPRLFRPAWPMEWLNGDHRNTEESTRKP